MFLSKIWFVLVGLLAGVALTAAFVAPRPADRRIEQLEGQRLDRAQYAAEQMLKTDARRWIDYVAKLGRDAVIAEALDSATSGKGEARMLHETVRNRLKTLAPDLPGIGLVLVGAVDARGRVVARVGEKENDHGEAIGGLEVLADALRGYQTDDVWGTGGRVLRVAAAPVLSKTRDRIVGALYVGADTGKRLAELWKKNLGVEIAILLKKQVVSTTVNEAFLQPLPDLIDQRRQELAEAKRTRALPLQMGSDRLLAVVAPFAGQAAEQDAYYVLMGKKAPASDPFALLSSTAADDLKWGQFPWLPLAGGILAILGIGLWLQRWEMEGPLARLRKDLKRLANGELAKLDDKRYPGKFGSVARDVNAAMERYTHPSRADGKQMGALLDGESSGIRSTSSVFTPSASSPSPFTPSASSPFAPSAAPASPFTPSAAPASPFTPGVASPFASSSPRLYGASAKPGAPGPLPRAPLSASPSGSLGTRPPGPPPLRPGPPPAPPPARPEPRESPVADAVELRLSAGMSAVVDDDETNEMREEATKTLGPADADDVHMREVFAEYVAARQRTGESTAGLTLEKFRSKLEANKQQLIAKYACRTARFSVYVKDGKAAIKATPIKD